MDVFGDLAVSLGGHQEGHRLWAGLENYLLDIAATTEPRMTVFTAPVLAANDPPYRGIRLPRFFWKIAVWLRGNVLAATGYRLSKDELVPPVLAIEFPELARVDEFEPGPRGVRIGLGVLTSSNRPAGTLGP